jgi:hypothetical protein
MGFKSPVNIVYYFSSFNLYTMIILEIDPCKKNIGFIFVYP